MKKTFKIVMLPTEKAGIICLNTNEQLYLSKEMNMADDNNEYQHLYIISDDEIKEGDWVYQDRFYEEKPVPIMQFSSKDLVTNANESELCKKVIASTDSELKITKSATGVTDGGRERTFYSDKLLPQIPESFIKAYIKAYNEGKPITEVDLEMDGDESPAWSGMWKYWPKTRPDNTVIVHQSKMYSRNEVEYLIKCATDEILHVLGYDTGKKMKETGVMSHINKWIQDNL